MRASSVIVCLSLFGCTGEPVSDSITAPVIDLPASTGYAEAGLGWNNRPIPQHQNDIVTVNFFAHAYSSEDAVDTVIGLSSQPAHAFSDLGPIVRFNPDGKIDARNGSGYAAASDFTYAIDHDYAFHVVVDLGAKRYSVDVRDGDSRVGDTWHPIAVSYAFRTEQAAMSRLDNVAMFVDSPSGAMSTSYFEVTPDVCTSGSPGWVSFAYPEQPRRFIVQAEVTGNPGGNQYLDAVVGLSRYAPRTFTDLGAILRFRPDGYLDARDGSAYRMDQADWTNKYWPDGAIRVYYFVDMDSETYTLEIAALDHGGSPQGWLARDYHFRTEQQGVVSLGWIGGYVDGPGTIRICNVVASPQT
jgi:hypothetical protein